jgi:hypothetical protein
MRTTKGIRKGGGKEACNWPFGRSDVLFAGTERVAKRIKSERCGFIVYDL